MAIDLGMYLTDLKDKHSLTNEKLAEKSNVPISTIAKIVSGRTKSPKIETLKALLDAMEEPMPMEFGAFVTMRNDDDDREDWSMDNDAICQECKHQCENCMISKMEKNYEHVLDTSREAYTHAYNELRNMMNEAKDRESRYESRFRYLVMAVSISLALVVVGVMLMLMILRK